MSFNGVHIERTNLTGHPCHSFRRVPATRSLRYVGSKIARRQRRMKSKVTMIALGIMILHAELERKWGEDEEEDHLRSIFPARPSDIDRSISSRAQRQGQRQRQDRRKTDL
ncbi:hypothetical protein IE53DRAFT_155188 [Violaceomyces palustris]|uniref:Uncharacterized protein n=1 Tax=Violaceomyces palustris TaxID=1673888 RepID=A0ACD0NTT1_9BASI|nr:hypothetical protein IE53DRAFT_155188 [Violaceomyces palustris]